MRLARPAPGLHAATVAIQALEAQVGGLHHLQVFTPQLEPQLGGPEGEEMQRALRCGGVQAATRAFANPPGSVSGPSGHPSALCWRVEVVPGGQKMPEHSLQRQAVEGSRGDSRPWQHSVVNGTNALNSAHKDG